MAACIIIGSELDEIDDVRMARESMTQWLVCGLLIQFFVIP